MTRNSVSPSSTAGAASAFFCAGGAPAAAQPEELAIQRDGGPDGLALFFTLSGFLITRFLLTHDSIRDFIIRRFFRIVPLAWLALIGATSFAVC